MAAVDDAVVGQHRLVFVSYSHADREPWLRRLLVLLEPVVRNRFVRVWADEYIPVGGDWRRNIADAIDDAEVALLLVSGDFLASRFIIDEELPALVARGVRLAPVLLSDCLWEAEPLLAGVQWIHDPGRDGPLDRDCDRASERDRRLVEICRRLLKLLPEHRPDQSRPAGTVRPRQSGGRMWYPDLWDRFEAELGGPVAADMQSIKTRPLTPSEVLGELHGVPAPPPGYLARDELDALVDAMSDVGTGAFGIAAVAPAVGLHGQGGIGKSVLAAALAHDQRIRSQFPDGVYWVTVGERADLVAAQLDLLTRLGRPDAVAESATAGAELLREALADRRVLLIVDDVWSSAAARAFRVTGRLGRVLYTSRSVEVLDAAGAAVTQLDVLSPAQARALAASVLETTADRLPPKADRALAAAGRVPLAVALVAAAVRGGLGWAQALAGLDAGSAAFGDHPYANTFKAMQVATGVLPADLRAAYLSLAAYPRDIEIPVRALARYWRRRDVDLSLRALASAGLVRLADGTFSFHDLQHDYLLLYAEDLPLLHADLLAAYRALAGEGWWRLPAGEPYIWDHLVFHLHGAGERSELAATVTDVAYLAGRIAQGGPHAAERDLAAAAAALPTDARLPTMRDWIARRAHAFAGFTDAAELAPTMRAWLQTGVPDGIDTSRIDLLLPPEHLSVRWGLPTASDAEQRVLAGHTGGITALAYHPDGRQLATASYDNTVRLWNTATGQPAAVLTGHTAEVAAVAYRSDGAQLATASWDGTVRLWDTATGQPAAVLTGHTAEVTAVAYRPDGGQLASAGQDSTVRLWDPATGRCVATLAGHSTWMAWMVALAYHPDGTQLATGDWDTTRLWGTTNGRLIRTLHGESFALAYRPDGAQLAIASLDGAVELWNPATGQHMFTLSTGSIEALAYRFDGRQLATAGRADAVHLWDPITGRRVATLTGHTGPVDVLAYRPDGAQLATASRDGTVRLWDTATGRPAAVLPGHNHPVIALGYRPDGGQLASGSIDHTVRLWNPATGQPSSAGIEQASPVAKLACHPAGTTVASAGRDNTVRLWHMDTGRCVAGCAGHTEHVGALAYRPNGGQLASGSDDHTVRLWDTASSRCLAILAGHDKSITDLDYRPDGSQLATASGDGTVRLWDPDTRHCIATLTGHNPWVMAVAYRPDGAQLATQSWDKTVRLWDPDAGRCTAVLTAVHLADDENVVHRLDYHPAGSQLATVDSRGTVLLWNPATGHRLAALTGHTGQIAALAYHPDGRQLATGGADGLRLWDSSSGRCTAMLPGSVAELAYHPDGTRLAVANPSGLISILDVHAGYAVAMQLRLLPTVTLAWSGESLVVAAGRTPTVLQVTRSGLTSAAD